MGDDKFFHLILFFFYLSMSLLIFSSSYLLFFLAWDGLGLTRAWLIFFYKNKYGFRCGWYVFLTMRLGDAFFLAALGTFFYGYSFIWIAFPPSILLVLAAFTKSAQFPFTRWLPLAIAAPTPVSALVHSRTLVTAGIWLLFQTSQWSEVYRWVLVPLGLVTSLIGGRMASVETDLKKTIAFRTLSNCGVIIFGLGIGSYDLVFIHLSIHAFFKRLLFIIAGKSIRATFGGQDLRKDFGSGGVSTWLAVGVGLIGAPFIGVWYRKHGIVSGWYPILGIIMSVILRAFSIFYIFRVINIALLHSNTLLSTYGVSKSVLGHLFLPVGVTILMPGRHSYFDISLILLLSVLIYKFSFSKSPILLELGRLISSIEFTLIRKIKYLSLPKWPLKGSIYGFLIFV